MKQNISGTWVGFGTDISQIIGYPNPIFIGKIKLILTFTEVKSNVYNVDALYYIVDSVNYYGEILKANSLYYQTSYL